MKVFSTAVSFTATVALVAAEEFMSPLRGEVAAFSSGPEDDPCHKKYHDEASCAADTTLGGGCVWCVCGALPSSCWTIADAKKLPKAVFNCHFPSSSQVDGSAASKEKAELPELTRDERAQENALSVNKADSTESSSGEQWI
ncbi:unnamed protein product [Amoebophrya sp. A120]|nr:unnamed protein product [Amoebophrya sp. A120]|eukprot:GSA120T00007452001.1